jgi:hypothetical protein
MSHNCCDSSSSAKCPKISKCALKKCYSNKNVKDAVNRTTLFLTGQFAELVSITNPNQIFVVPGDQDGLLPFAGIYTGPEGLAQLLLALGSVVTPVAVGEVLDIYVNCGFTQVVVVTNSTSVFNCPATPDVKSPPSTYRTLFILYYNSKGEVQKAEIINQNDVIIPYLAACSDNLGKGKCQTKDQVKTAARVENTPESIQKLLNKFTIKTPTS